MKAKTKKPSLLTKKDINNICGVEIISDSNETFSQTCVRYGNLLHNDEENGMTPHQYEENYMISAQLALQSFCEDNSIITEEEFSTWYQQLIDDEELFRLDRNTDALWKDACEVFDAKMNKWIAEGALDANYNTYCLFCAIIIMAIKSTYEKMGIEKLNDNMFFKDPILGKYKIMALDYADNTSLKEFDNPRAYDRFNVEGLITYAMGGFDEYEDYRKTLDIYQEVKDIIYEDPNRLLSETKKILVQRAKHDKIKKMQYAVLYAAAVIEWYLKHH